MKSVFVDNILVQPVFVDNILQAKLSQFLQVNPADIGYVASKQSKKSKRYSSDLNYGVVTSAVLDDVDYQSIVITCDRVICSITAYDDNFGGNASLATLSIIKGDLNMLIGQEIKSIETLEGEEELEKIYPDFKDSEYHQYVVFAFTLFNGNIVHILSEHHCNGYYGGGANI